MPINKNLSPIIKIVFPNCEPAINHFRFTLSLNRGVKRLDTNLDVVMVKGTKDAAVADPAHPSITPRRPPIQRTSPMLAKHCPINNNERFLFNFYPPN